MFLELKLSKVFFLKLSVIVYYYVLTKCNKKIGHLAREEHKLPHNCL